MWKVGQLVHTPRTSKRDHGQRSGRRRTGVAVTASAVLAAGLVTAPQIPWAAAAPAPQQVRAAAGSPGDSDLRRCARQVSDTGKVVRPADGYALDTGVAGNITGPSSADPTPRHRNYTGTMKTIWDEPDSGQSNYLGANAMIFGVDAGTASAPSTALRALWTASADVGNAKIQNYSANSANGGESWSAPSLSTAEDPSFLQQLRDGRVLSLGFKAIRFSGNDQILVGSITDSTGNAATAEPIEVIFRDAASRPDSPLGWLRSGGRPIQRADGTVLIPIYGADRTDPRFSDNNDKTTPHTSVSILAATPPAPGGQWVFTPLRPDMAAPLSPTNKAVTLGTTASKTVNYSEVGLLERPDGSLIAVIRNLVQGQSSGSDVMLWSSSADGGLTWSPLTNLQGTLTGWNGNGSPQPGTGAAGLPGINPQLDLLTNGVIVLSSGKPDNWIAYSSTGNATDWSGAYTYRNCPTTAVIPSTGYYKDRQWTPPADNPTAPRPPANDPTDDPDQWRYGSSGNTAITTVSSKRVLQAGDNCHNYFWGCVRTDASNQAQPQQSPYTVDLTSRIWQRQVDVVTPNVGKLDLAGMQRSGQLTVSGNMTWTSAAHPRAGAAGAFDGSNNYWSSAIADGADGTMTLDLGRKYTLNRIGLSLRPQLPASATVAVSVDGSAFSTVHSVSDTRSNALAYKDIAPVKARYVRVSVPAVSGCDAGLAASCAFLNELELYSTVDGFENDPWGNLPRGANAGRPSSQVWVTTDTSGGSTQALRLQDKSSTAQATISFPAPAAANRTLMFRVKPLTWASNTSAGGFVFTLDSGSTAALQLAVYKDGTVHAYSGGRYSAALGTGKVALNAWSTISLSRTGDSTRLSVNGAPPVPVPAASVPATVDGFTFASSGTEPSGDEVLVDDVEVR